MMRATWLLWTLAACGEVQGNQPDAPVVADTLPPDTVTCTPTMVEFAPVATESLNSSPGSTIAQTITLPSRTIVDDLRLPLGTCKANGLVDGRVAIHPTIGASNVPDGLTTLATSLVGNAAIVDACVGGTFGFVSFTFTPPVTLERDVVYAIALEAIGAGAGSLSWRRSSTPTDPSDPYAGGTNWETNGGSFATGNTNLDLAFEVRGQICD